MTTAEAIQRTLQSPNVADKNLEASNVVDVLDDLAMAAHRIAYALEGPVVPNDDAYGNRVRSVVDAVYSVSAALTHIGDSIKELAESVRYREI